MMIDKQKIDEIIKKIADNYQPDKIIMFGSYAYGNPNNTSDLDLLIIKVHPCNEYKTKKNT